MIEYTSPNYPNDTLNEYELESMFDDWLDEVEGVALVYAGVRTRIEHGGPDCWRIEALDVIEDNR